MVRTVVMLNVVNVEGHTSSIRLFWILLQILYIFGGLLIIFACINAFPLRSVTRLAHLGVFWQIAGMPWSACTRSVTFSPC